MSSRLDVEIDDKPVKGGVVGSGTLVGCPDIEAAFQTTRWRRDRRGVGGLSRREGEVAPPGGQAQTPVSGGLPRARMLGDCPVFPAQRPSAPQTTLTALGTTR